MSYKIPTTQSLADGHLSRLEGQLGQESPLNDKSFLQVLSITEAGFDIGLYKYAADRVKQNLALTATGDDLDRIGNDNYTPRKPATSAILIVDLVATNGTIIQVGREFVGDSNGLRYKNEAEVTAAGGMATLTLRCVDQGSDGNLDVGNTLSISAQVAGAETQATVTSVDTLGANKESDTDYRPRVLFAQRAFTGGGNAADHKIWGEAVSGVKTIFPFSGRPDGEGTSYPGDRTLYVEATTDIDPDGIAPTTLIASVRTAAGTDPDTGESRFVLGLTDDNLWVESIIRTPVNVIIENFFCPEDSEADCKNDIEESLTAYFLTLRPFVAAIDLIQEKKNVITKVAISEVVQDVMKTYGAYATDIVFEVYDGEYYIEETEYELADNEMTKLAQEPEYV
jgi:hypothetical protein